MKDDDSLIGEAWLDDEFRSCCDDDDDAGSSEGEIDSRAAGGDGVEGNPSGDNDATRSGDDGIEILV